MNANVIPLGVRLDEWPKPPEPTTESLTVAALQGEFRKRMPKVVELLEATKELRQTQELAAQLAGPVQAQLVMTKTTAILPPQPQ